MRARALSTIGAVLLSLCGSGAAWSTSRSVTALCTLSGSTTNTDTVDRGIFLTNYPGNNLSQAELAYVAATGQAGQYSISLTARRGSFDGPIIGSTQTRTVQVGDVAGGTYTDLYFDFGAAPVTPGDTITFTHTFEGPGILFMNVGGGSCPGVFEANGTRPPLDSVIRHSVAIATLAVDLSTSCIPSDTVMCIDDNPGDQRFKITSTFHTSQNGGISGIGQEIPLAPLGVSQGGLFWFFNAGNPEMLVKVIDGCPVNGHFWVFLSAGTNVSFNVLVVDKNNGHAVLYHNNDLTPAFPVQDVNALTCP